MQHTYQICCRVTDHNLSWLVLNVCSPNLNLKTIQCQCACNFFFQEFQVCHYLRLYEKCMTGRNTTFNNCHTCSISNNKSQIFHFSAIRRQENMCQPVVWGSVVTTHFLFWLGSSAFTQCSNSCSCKINARWMHVGRCMREPPLYYTAC